ncbi:hypothetical protein [Nisaea sediminum]|uniref:hypothetical protein n=1 Tax=Nisaea sediminum TaxID=2775867 RepID=UPI001865C0BD|nr:hypothetical protein [Nisaea sediminum]
MTARDERWGDHSAFGEGDCSWMRTICLRAHLKAPFCQQKPASASLAISGYHLPMQRILWFVLATFIVEFFVAPLGSRSFEKWFPNLGDPSSFIPDLPWYQAGYWTVLALGVLTGATVAHWKPHWFGWPKKKPVRPDTRLRLRLDPSGNGQYVEVSGSNIESWQQAITRMESQNQNEPNGVVFHNDNLAITFTIPIEYERPIIETYGHQITGYNFYPLGRTGVFFQFLGALQPPAIEIWFPPFGYYQSRGASEDQRSPPQMSQVASDQPPVGSQ